MTSLLETAHQRATSWTGTLPRWTVPAAVAIAVAARIPSISRAPTPDEAGYLLVGSQWNGAGSSLYGNYWVDRPPLLISLFRLAGAWGGITTLRLLGCVAVVIVVLGVARVAHLLGGHHAARWSAVLAAALCMSPLLGVYTVNGELLAAPFIVAGLAAVVVATESNARATTWWSGSAAGAMAVCALLVKQNFVDVAVFAVAMLGLSALQRAKPRRHLLRVAGGFALGAAVTAVSFAAWTVAHGTSLVGVYEAMYPFRIAAGQVIADGGRSHADARLSGLVIAAMLTGLLPLIVYCSIGTLRRRERSVPALALLVLLSFAMTSVLLGGSYWLHYLVGLFVPTSILAGLLAARGHRPARWLIGWCLALAAVTWAGDVAVSHPSPDQNVGAAIHSVSSPSDTIVSLYGRADIVQASELNSPYEHLWSLPIKTLDPHLTGLNAVLSGDHAPTWLVTGPTLRSWGLDTTEVAMTVHRRYDMVQTMCGDSIYLLRGTDRPAPTLTGGTCPMP